MRIDRITLQRVEFMPKQLEPGILYISEKYGTAAHLCACGCGEKVRTPLGPTEWKMRNTASGPSLWPSVGSWQKPCQSHYVIDRGRIIWREKWSADRIITGRLREEGYRRAYYDKLARRAPWRRFLRWMRSLIGGDSDQR
jgi:hypothetical protein